MKRRNAETGKMRRSVKRTKITEGSYGKYYPQHAYLVYLKFVLVWATVMTADHMVHFRFEFLWPFSMMLRSLYDSFKYQGLSFSVFFICIVLTSDMICFFFIPMQYIFFAAGTYVWVHYLWYSLADKGVCVPTVLLCCVLVYMESIFRDWRCAMWRPLAAHCVGYPAASLGFNLKSYLDLRLRQRRQRQVREQNEFYCQLLREALPDAQPQNNNKEVNNSTAASSASATESANASTNVSASETRHMNGTVKRRTKEQNGHCTADSSGSGGGGTNKLDKSSGAQTKWHAQANGSPPGAAEDDDKHDHSKGSAKSAKCEKKEAISIKEEKRKHKNKDKDKDSDSHKSTEQIKQQLVNELESTSTKDNHIRNHKDSTSNKEREKEKERDKDREREVKEKEREREKDKEKEQKSSRDYWEELKSVRAELAASRVAEAEARRALAAALAADRRHRTDFSHLKQAHASLQQKFDSVSAKVSVWRGGERAALERRLSEERRARALAEHHLLRARHHASNNNNNSATTNGNGNTTPSKTNNGECDSEWCKSKVGAHEAETASLRQELRRAHERADMLQRELHQAIDQVRSLESRREECSSPTVRTCPHGHVLNGTAGGSRVLHELQERAAHLERSLSAETRVKLDLLSALGDAKRHMTIQEGLISRQEKEIEELKAQMVAVLPSLPVTSQSQSRVHSTAQSHTVARRSDSSPLDPNASVYTPKQLCSDA